MNLEERVNVPVLQLPDKFQRPKYRLNDIEKNETFQPRKNK